jgi:tRNA-dihydrouridine synthase B
MTAPIPAPGRPPPLRLGEVNVAPPIILAPLSSLTNLPMRALCEEAGCGLTVTEFLPAPALAAGVKKELHKLQPSPKGRVWSAQIFGRDPGQMATAARLCVERGASLVDINMGCPARKVTKGVSGAALMREPELAESLVRAVKDAAAGRALVTIKTRAGWDEAHKTAPEFCERMVAAGAQAVAIHGRTRMQAFKGEVDLEIIARVKERLGAEIPVIGNGDVVDAATTQRMFEQTGCDAVMIGRAALGNPWLFGALNAWWTGAPPPPEPTVQQRLRMYLRHLDLYLTIADHWHAVMEMRKYAGWYMRGFHGAAALRKGIYALEHVEAIRRYIWDAMDRGDG